MTEVNRQIKKSELKELKNLLQGAYQSDEDLGIHFKAAQIPIETLKRESETLTTFVTIKDQKIIATVSVRFPWSINPSRYNFPHLCWVATNPNYAHQGYATKLIKWVEQKFLTNQLHAEIVSLGTAVEHPWLVNFYEKLGYHAVETQQKFKDHLTVYLIKVFNPEIKNDQKRLKQLGLTKTFQKGVS